MSTHETSNLMDMGKAEPPFMWMWFHTKIQDTVLFESWNITDVGTLIWACALIVLAGVLLEGIKFLRWIIQNRQKNNEVRSTKYLNRLFSPLHLAQTCLFLVQLGFSYCLMLIFMTFSIWLGIAVVIGLTIGFFAFGSRTTSQ